MKRKFMTIGIILLFVILILFYLYYENNILQVSYYSINGTEIPKAFNGYKIVQISDFHNTKSNKLNNTLIENISNIKPNIIVITGDLIDSNKTNLNIAVEFVKKIKDIAPIYYVTGNHEASTKDYNNLKDSLTNLGVKVLDNKLEILELNGDAINILGIDDPHFAHENAVTDEVIINTEIDKINYNQNNYTILLSHRPELYETYVDKNINLVLSGHAHGGQIRLPFLKSVIAPNQGFFPKYSEGTFTKNNTTMVVSRGLGNSVLPFRINNRPELVVVSLVSD